MYSRFQLAKKYLKYYLHASSGKGYGVHSPFVYDFIVNVLHGKEKPDETGDIEQYRKSLLANHNKIIVDDFGAGSSFSQKRREREVSDIAKTALKSKKYAELLYRITDYYRCKNIVELGTSLGTTTAYLASAAREGAVITLEGADNVADIASEFFDGNNFKNIQLVRGDFKEKIPEILDRVAEIDLLFVDGNHREDPTWSYFKTFLTKIHNGSIFIFDDIHWSREMERVWEKIKSHSSVTLTIDLFFFGLVFFRKEFMIEQDFAIRF